MKKSFGMLALLAMLSACGSVAEEQTVPEGFVVPQGVELTAPLAELNLGQAATWIATPTNGSTTVLVGSVNDVINGEIKDFFGFALGEAAKTSQPIYVNLQVRNGGPEALNEYALPIYADVNASEILPPLAIKGPFNPCQVRELPEQFTPGTSSEICLVYLIPAGKQLDSMRLVLNEEQYLTWRVAQQ